MVNILIAEDDRDHFLMLEEAVEQSLPQYRITHCRDGKECLQKLEDSSLPDLIFLDLNLPKKRGLDCLVDIRSRPALQATPVVIYSTSSHFEDIDRCYKNGCTLYLVKPPSFKELLSQVRGIFSHELAQEALRRSEDQFRLFMQSSSQQVYRISADWKEMYLLAGKEFMSDTKQLSSAWLEEYIPTADQASVWQAIRSAMDNGRQLELEHRIRREDGTLGWVFFRAVPVRDEQGRVTEWFGASHDISDRKRSEEELKEEHGFLEQITDNTPHLIYVYDLEEQRFIYVNRRIAELTAIPQDYVYGMGPHLFKMVIHPGDLSQRTDYMNGLSRLQEGDGRENEFRIRVGDQYRWFRSKDRIFKRESGQVTQVIGLAEDVTYEKGLRQKMASDPAMSKLN